LRPIHDPDRLPYWKRNVRTDFLQFRFKEFKFNLISNIYDIRAKEIGLFYYETEKQKNPIYFGKASFENITSKFYPPSMELPRIIIQIPTDTQLQEMNEEFIREHQSRKDDSDSDPTSNESIKIKPNLEKDSTPFSQKRVCRESDTPHNKSDEGKI
jgi:autophagy-related protein 2